MPILAFASEHPPRRWTITIIASLLAGAITAASDRPATTVQGDGYRVATLVSGLDTPWDLAWGPDNMIWMSERGGRVSLVDPSSGQRTTIATLAVREAGEGGLMGIALHPDFARTPFLYAMHTYAGGDGGTLNRLVRLRWNGTALVDQQTLLDGIPGAGIHNGSRIAVGPDRMLYVSTGDAGNSGLAQNRESLAGKILRLDLDGRPASRNPFGTAVWSYGHRNPQGLVFHPHTGALYSSEQGPGDNDEVNLIRRGGNHGWPNVHGRCDDDSGNEREFCRANEVVEPLVAWTPTIATCGTDLYLSDAIPGWRGSLLVTALRGSALHRLTLSADGARVTERAVLLSGDFGRLRDVLVAPNGDVYVATSNRDGRGSPRGDDDRILRLTPSRGSQRRVPAPLP
jgi:glucose/arabinose dehydrogenase